MPIYLDCASVHNHLVKEYGLTNISIFETTLGDPYWFRGQCNKGCPYGSEVVMDREEIYDYYHLKVPITYFKPKEIKE